GSTFGGNPVAAAAGNALLAVLTAPGFLPEVKKKSHLLIRTLQRLKNKHPRLVREVRGLGLLVGIELSGNAQQAVAHALAHGLLINNPTGQVIRILPPYTVTDEEIELFAEKFDAALARCEKGA
ncbi:MAG TPA: aminotransferase class III-fold pyridoxal phosphate-dependent enzyme, partial [Spirochaetia bacterium]|nr:aminotransferase class III-fold pyridoxal phosphate-dependent enzyme [Spirochaetia bacterium]